MPTTYTCKISESWYASLESAYIRVTTPKGTDLRIDKRPPARFKHQWDKNEKCKELVWRIYEEAKNGKIELTKEEIMMLALHSNHQTTDIKPPRYSKSIAWEWGAF